jgi:hypothetical protein
LLVVAEVEVRESVAFTGQQAAVAAQSLQTVLYLLRQEIA